MAKDGVGGSIGNSYLAPGDDLPPLLRGGLQISWPQRFPQTMSENPAGLAATKRSPLAVLGRFWRLLMAWFQAVFAKLGGKRKDASDPNSVSLSDGSQLLSGRSGSGGDGSYTMEDLPPEVLARVLALVPARQLAQCSAVCRLWRQVAAADSLWERHWERDEKGYEAGPYAEKYLRLGRRAISAHPLPLPPRLQTFAARCQLPRCVVVDAGSGYCKYGWSEQLRPQGTVPTFLEFGNIESPTLPRLKKLYSAVFNSLGAKAPQQPVIISEPLCYNADPEASRQQRRSFRQMTCEVLFDKLKVPAICSVDQAFLALTAAQMRSGIVVNIGFRNTTILPVLNGRPLRPLTSGLLALGAMRLTTVLSDLMDRAHLHYMSMFTVRTIKEELCYVAQNYDEEMDKPLTKASCDVRGEGVFDLDQQRFQAPEILFQPALCGSPQEDGLAQLVATCMEKCAEIPVADPEDAGWFQNVLLMGGSACIPGLPERLQKDVMSLVPAPLREHVRVIPPTHGPHAPWFGAKVISNLSTMPGAWCITREQYHTLGMDFVHAMSCDDD